MRSQEICFLQLVSNQRSVNERLTELEKAVREGHQIDAENDVIMVVTPPMPREPQVHFADILTQCIRDPACRGMLNEPGLVLATGQKEEAVSKTHPFAQQVTLALATMSQEYG